MKENIVSTRKITFAQGSELNIEMTKGFIDLVCKECSISDPKDLDDDSIRRFLKGILVGAADNVRLEEMPDGREGTA